MVTNMNEMENGEVITLPRDEIADNQYLQSEDKNFSSEELYNKAGYLFEEWNYLRHRIKSIEIPNRVKQTAGIRLIRVGIDKFGVENISSELSKILFDLDATRTDFTRDRLQQVMVIYDSLFSGSRKAPKALGELYKEVFDQRENTGELTDAELVFIKEMIKIWPILEKVYSTDKLKRPKDYNWENSANYKPDDTVIESWCKAGGNYGIALGYGNLICLDEDVPGSFEKAGIFQHVPQETWTDTTGKGRHYFYICKDIEGLRAKYGAHTKIKNANGEDIGDLKIGGSGGTQVVGPGSLHPSGKRYQIERDTAPAEITIEQVEAFMSSPAVPQKQQKEREGGSKGGIKVFRQDGTEVSIMEVIRPQDVASADGAEIKVAHPLHGSEHGNNLAINILENTWYCHRCNTGGGPLEWLAIESGLVACGETVRGWFKKLTRRERAELQEYIESRGFKVDLSTSTFSEDFGRAMILQNKMPNVLFAPHLGKWLLYDGSRWKPETEEAILVLAAKELVSELDGRTLADDDEAKKIASEKKKVCKLGTVMAALTFLKGLVQVEATELDSNGWLLNLENGTLDLRDGSFREHREEDLITKMAPVRYDPSAQCPKWMAHIEMFLPNKDIRRQVQRDLGRSLVGKVLEEVLGFWYGEKGANGKTTTARVIMALLGEYAKKAAPNLLIKSKHERHPTEIADLAGARIVFSIEVEEGSKLALAIVKDFTGGDTKKGRFMRQDFFEFPQTFDIILIANNKPIMNAADEATWRRVRLIPWTYYLPRELRRSQDEVVEELVTEEGPGILNWLLEGLRDWQQDHYWIAQEVIAATDEWKAEEDSVARFMSEHYTNTKDNRDMVPFSAIYQDYVNWCNSEDETLMTKKTFSAALRKKGYVLEKKAAFGPAIYNIIRKIEITTPEVEVALH